MAKRGSADYKKSAGPVGSIASTKLAFLFLRTGVIFLLRKNPPVSRSDLSRQGGTPSKSDLRELLKNRKARFFALGNTPATRLTRSLIIMLKNILITGLPKTGKSTLLENLVSGLPRKVGFITREVVNDKGRIGFEIQTHPGNKTMLTSVNFLTPFKVSRYCVDIGNLESIIPEISAFANEDILYLDEIDQMELFSEKFKELVITYLNSPNTCVATVSKIYDDDFMRSIKRRNDVLLVEITEGNRDSEKNFLQQLLRKIEKAKKYILEPERFGGSGFTIDLKSEHGFRILKRVGKRWICSCDFFTSHKICSHSIATEELFPESRG